MFKLDALNCRDVDKKKQKTLQYSCTAVQRNREKKNNRHPTPGNPPNPWARRSDESWMSCTRDGLSWCNWDITGIKVSEISPLNW